jgi:hypothetical protein
MMPEPMSEERPAAPLVHEYEFAGGSYHQQWRCTRCGIRRGIKFTRGRQSVCTPSGPPEPTYDDLLAEVRRLRETADVLWDTMNRDTKPYAALNLQERGLPQIEDDWIPKNP